MDKLFSSVGCFFGGNRVSLSLGGGKLYAHTIKEVICIGE